MNHAKAIQRVSSYDLESQHDILKCIKMLNYVLNEIYSWCQVEYISTGVLLINSPMWMWVPDPAPIEF